VTGGDDVDVLGIGFGPGNIALAVALREMQVPARVRFLERQPTPLWQPGMLLAGSDVQHHAARDLVLPRNPRSRYTFYNYLFEQGRLFEYLNLGQPFPLRKDYARYVAWVADDFADQVTYGAEVHSLCTTTRADGTPAVRVRLGDGTAIRAAVAVVAPGRTPRIPPVFAGHTGDRVFHAARYGYRIAGYATRPGARIAVVGGSQSAVELLLDISGRYPRAVVTNVIRDFGHRQKDLSPFTGEVYYPQFTDYYYDASSESKSDLDRQLRYTNYSAADPDVLQLLYARLYEDRLDGTERVRLLRNADITTVRTGPDGVTLELRERHTGQHTAAVFDAVVLATGYHDLSAEDGPEFLPAMLDDVAAAVERTDTGRARISRDYRLVARAGRALPPIYLNGLCESSHGLGDAGSFSLLSVRSGIIAGSIRDALAAAAPVDGDDPVSLAGRPARSAA
jgi:L-ornithine N5-oxygenase